MNTLLGDQEWKKPEYIGTYCCMVFWWWKIRYILRTSWDSCLAADIDNLRFIYIYSKAEIGKIRTWMSDPFAFLLSHPIGLARSLYFFILTCFSIYSYSMNSDLFNIPVLHWAHAYELLQHLLNLLTFSFGSKHLFIEYTHTPHVICFCVPISLCVMWCYNRFDYSQAVLNKCFYYFLL